jgi:hypothetical protein
MEKTEAQIKLEFLSNKVKESFDFYNTRRIDNKLKGFRLKMAATVFSVLITIVAGISLSENAYYSKIANLLVLVFGGAITIFNTWDTFYNHKDMWIKYTENTTRLHALDIAVGYVALSPDLTLAQVDELFDQYYNIIEEAGKSWVQLRIKTKEKEDDNNNK